MGIRSTSYQSLVERMPIETKECLRQLDARLITVDVLGIADAPG
jgi:hypothetical protein